MPRDSAFVGDEGIAWYCGAPGSGKTTLAIEHASAACRATGWPILILDSTRANQFRGMAHAKNVAEVLETLYRRRAHAVYWSEDQDDVEALCRGVRAGRRVIFLIDESAFWFNAARGRQGEMLRLMRAWRHCDVRLLLTTQHLSGDVPQEAWACSPRVFLFRTTSPAGLDVAERQWGFKPEEVKALPVGGYVEYPAPISQVEKTPEVS